MFKFTEEEVKILMADRCTRNEAESALQRGAIIWDAEDFEKNLESYMDGWGCLDDSEKEEYRHMIATKAPVKDWSYVEYEGKAYYIQYVN